MSLKTVFSLVAFIWIFGRVGFAQPLSIVPGKSVGVICLGTARTEVYRRLGNPTQSWTLKHNAENYREDVWCRKQKEYSSFFTVITSRERVVQIEVSDTHFKTLKDFSTANDFQRCRRLYPHLRVEQYIFYPLPYNPLLLGYGEWLGECYYMDDFQHGLAVSLRSQCDKVDYELPLLNPDSIIVHKAKVSILPILSGNWAEPDPRHEDDYLNEMQAWFTGGIYRPRSAQQILMMQKKAEAKQGNK